MTSKNKSFIYHLIGFCLGIFLFGPSAEPIYFENFSALISIYTLWKRAAEILSFYLLIYIVLRNKKGLKLNHLVLPFSIIIYYVYFIVLTVLTGGYYRQIVSHFIGCFYVCACFYLALTWNDDSLLSGGLFIYASELYLNFILMIIKPEGFYYPTFGAYAPLLGYKNVILRNFFPGLVFALALDFIQKKKISFRSWLYLIVLFITSILADSTTSIVATAILIISILIFGNMKHISKLANLRIFFIASLIVLFMIIILQVSTPMMIYLTGIFNKDVTFTGRVYLWNQAINYITKKPIFGYGFEGYTVLNQKFYIGIDFSYESCHNFYLDMVYRSGLIGMFIMALIILQADYKMNNPFIDKNVRLYFILLSLIYFVSWNFEPFVDESLHNVFGFFLFLYYLWEENSLIYRKYNDHFA